MTKKREALPQRGQRGRRKLGEKKEVESCWMEDRERERDEVKDGKEAGRQHKRLRRRQRERESDRQTDHRWRRTTATNFTWRLFLLLLAGRTGAACGNNHPPNAS